MSDEPTPSPSAPDSSFLTPSQRRTIGFTLTLAATFGTVALIVTGFIALGRMVTFFSSVLWPLAVAGVLALILRPVVDLNRPRLSFG
jgi:predicted PurR-regulated permease PerM